MGDQLSLGVRGNDPLKAGSCGRLTAGKALIDKLTAAVKGEADIEVGVSIFGDQAESTVPLGPLSSFASHLTADEFCGADAGATNYEAAFTEARDLLAGVDGPKVVYFVSDGMPTRANATAGFTSRPGDDVVRGIYDAGKAAAGALRKLDGLTLNTLFINVDPTGVDPNLPSDLDPKTYLEDITGDKDHVRVVTAASDLAAQIVSLDTPSAASLDATSVKGTVVAAKFAQRDVQVASVEKDPSREGVWTFETAPFELNGDAGRLVDNTITFTVKGADGKDYTATAIVHYTNAD
jgi:hypothetical protein